MTPMRGHGISSRRTSEIALERPLLDALGRVKKIFLAGEKRRELARLISARARRQRPDHGLNPAFERAFHFGHGANALVKLHLGPVLARSPAWR